MLIALLLIALAGSPQQPASPPVAEAPMPAAEPPAGGSGYTYDPGGRRDPFVSLVDRATTTKQTGAGATGVPGLRVDEISVKGIMRGQSGFIAMIKAADGKGYILHVGDRLSDGVVKSIAQDQVIFSQQVDDPLARVKQRDVAKRVRAATNGEALR